MKKENAIDRFQNLVLELACVEDVLTAIQFGLSEENILPRVATDAVCAVKSHIVRISNDLDHVLTAVRD